MALLAELSQRASSAFQRKERWTTRNRLRAKTAGTYDELRCVSAVTIDDYATHTGYLPGLHPGAARMRPSARVQRSRRSGGLTEMDKSG